MAQRSSINGIHNTMTDAISRLEFSPKINPTLNTDKQNWMILTKNLGAIEQFAQPENEQNMDINHVFASRSDEEDIFPLTISEIAEEQLKYKALQQRKKLIKYLCALQRM